MSALRRPLAARFLALTTPEPNTGCLLWAGNRANKYGYGAIRVGAHDAGWLLAHRVAWEITVGPIPQGMSVLHRCDNPACVLADPDPARSHLFLGTQADNMADMKQKGRAARGLRAGVLRVVEARRAQTHCHRGHALTVENLTASGLRHGRRDCRLCARERSRNRVQ